MPRKYQTKVTVPDHPAQLPAWICRVLESGKDVRITTQGGQVVCLTEPRQTEDHAEEAR